MHAASLVKLFVALVAAASPAVAELAVTAPIASTTCSGGQVCEVTWNDNGLNNVTLAQQGECTVALYTGNAQQQTFLQPIAFPTAVNVATTGAIRFTVDASIGPNSDQYFIRFESKNLTQTGTTKPYLSFSAKFKLDNMSGAFNSSVQAQLSGVTSAGPTATGSVSSTRSGSSSTRPTSSSTSTRSTSTGAASPNAAVGSAFVAAGAVFAGVVALF